MRKIITILLFVFILNLAVIAQDKDKKDEVVCPAVSISGPSESFAPGELQVFTVIISDNNVDETNLKIKWTVDNGKIISGQGTKSISVKDVDDAETIVATANVDLGGGCYANVSEVAVHGDPPLPRLVDEFGKIANGDIKARIDAFLVELQNDAYAQGYIINFGSSKMIDSREKLIRNYLAQRRFDSPRIVFVNGGKEKEIRTRLWLVPAGADASTID